MAACWAGGTDSTALAGMTSAARGDTHGLRDQPRRTGMTIIGRTWRIYIKMDWNFGIYRDKDTPGARNRGGTRGDTATTFRLFGFFRLFTLDTPCLS